MKSDLDICRYSIIVRCLLSVPVGDEWMPCLFHKKSPRITPPWAIPCGASWAPQMMATGICYQGCTWAVSLATNTCLLYVWNPFVFVRCYSHLEWMFHGHGWAKLTCTLNSQNMFNPCRTEFICGSIFLWLSARLQYLQCVRYCSLALNNRYRFLPLSKN